VLNTRNSAVNARDLPHNLALAKKNRPGRCRAGLPCETSRAPKALPLTAGWLAPPSIFLSLRFSEFASGPSELRRSVVD